MQYLLNYDQDEYLTLYMESNENHFFSIIKSIISSKHRAPHQVRASSTPSMMIPTPGMQQDRSTQSIVSGSVENPKMGGPSVECLPSTNMGNLQPTGNGLTDVNTPFNLANGNSVCLSFFLLSLFATFWSCTQMRCILLCSFQWSTETRYKLSSWFRCKKCNAF